jgi:hypothetical protein
MATARFTCHPISHGVGAVFLTAGLAAGAAGMIGGPAAHAALDPGSQYKLSGRADAMAIEYLNTAAPVFAENAIIYGTPATAIATLDSVGQSNALAAAPYPGDIMIGMPDNGKGVVAGFGGPAELFPTYPFVVTSSHPIKPDSVQDQSGNRLVAHSDQHASRGEARSGLITGDVLAALQAQASSDASVDDATGKLLAAADSRLDAFRLTEKLQIGKSTAHAKITREAGQAVVKESSFTIGSITVNGTSISYSDKGFQVGDQSPPSEQPPAGFFDSLKSAGITIEFLPARGTDTSIESAGLRISQVQQMGPATQRISFTLGHVSASIDGEAAPARDGLLDDTLPASNSSEPVSGASEPPASSLADGSGPPTAVSDSGAGTVAGPDASGVGLNGSGTVPGAASATTSVVPDLSTLPRALEAAAGSPNRTAPAPRVAASPPAGVRLVSPAAFVGHGLRDDDVSGLYVAVGAAAALMALAGFLLPGVARRRVPAPARSVLKLPGPTLSRNRR